MSLKLDATIALFSKLARQLKPPPRITVSEWSEENIWLGTDVSSIPGPWRNSLTPYLVEIQNSFNDPAVERVVVMSAARMGKTSALLHCIGYTICHDASPIMVVAPTLDLCEGFSKEQLSPLLRDTKCLRGVVSDPKSRDGNNTIKQKFFPGGYIVFAGANSPASLSMRTISKLFLDEVDRFPDSAGQEGDPVRLAERRTQTYQNRGRKIILTSTPTVKHASRIEQAYNQSTMEQWCLPCPSCGHCQPLEWPRLNFETLEHTCLECGCLHGKAEWLAGKGQWIARNPDSSNRGFQMNALISPFVTWESLVDEWREAVQLSQYGNNEQLRVFINTALGETFENRGERVDETGLMARREEYYADVPDGVCVLTMGVDTQDNRLCYEVVGWGAGKESWAIEYGELWGDPRVPGSPVWGQLDAVITKRRTYHNGKPVRVMCTAIDMGGHASDQVCAYAVARKEWNVWAVRGEGGQGKALVKSWSINKKTRATVFTLGVDSGKDEMMARLRVTEPGPGFCHFPKGENGETVRGIDERFFQGLTAERKVSVQVRGNFHKYIWEKLPGRQNEPFDCGNYASAALAILKPPLERIAEAAPWLAVLEQKKYVAGGAAVKKPRKGPGLNRNTQPETPSIMAV